MSRFIRVLLLAFVLLNAFAPLPVAASPYLQTATRRILLSPDFYPVSHPKRKWAAFVITFNGTATDENSAISRIDHPLSRWRRHAAIGE